MDIILDAMENRSGDTGSSRPRPGGLSVSVFQCFSVSVFQCFSVSVLQGPVFQCFSVSAHWLFNSLEKMTTPRDVSRYGW